MDADLAEILHKEEHSFLWEPSPEAGSIPIWPILRFEVITWLFLSKKKEISNPQHVPPAASWWRKKTHRLFSAIYNPISHVDHRAEIAYFTKGKSLVRGPAGQWNHPYADRLIRVCSSRSLVIEKSHLATLRAKGRSCSYRSYEPIEKEAHVLSRHLRKNASLANRSEIFVKKLEELFERTLDDNTRKRWKERVHEIMAKMRAFQNLHDELFQKWRFRTAIIEDAHYGDMALLVRAANRAGIVTAELQHGILDENHTAYAMSETTRSRLRELGMLPQAFLVWGGYWARKLGPGIAGIAVGKDVAGPVRKPFGKNRKPEPILLVISSGCSVSLLRELLPFLARETHKLGWSLRIRPHPSEKPSAGHIFPETPWMEFDPHEDLADSLAEAAVVFGDFSTALYEAAEAGRPVIIWENEGARLYSDPALGRWVRTRPELVSLLREGFGQKKNLSSSAMVEPGGLENYRNFLRSSGVSLL